MRYWLFLLCLTVGAYAQFGNPSFVGRLTFPTASTSGCSTPLDGNVLNEGFDANGGGGVENTGWNNSWPANPGSTAYALPGGSPAGTCTYGMGLMRTWVQGESAGRNRELFQPATTGTRWYRFYFNITTNTMTIQGQRAYLWAICEGGSLAYASLGLYVGPSTTNGMNLVLEGLDEGSGPQRAWLPLANPTGTWHWVDIQWSDTAGQCKFRIDGGSDSAGISHTQYAQGTMWIGAIQFHDADDNEEVAVIDSFGVIIDLIAVDNSDYIGP